MPEKPVKRKKNVEEGGQGVQRREEAKTGGPVGRKEGSLKEGAGKKPSGQKGGDRSTLGDLAQLGNLLGSGAQNQQSNQNTTNLFGGSGNGNNGGTGNYGNTGGSGRRGGCSRILLYLIVIIVVIFLLRSCLGSGGSSGGGVDLNTGGTANTTNTTESANTNNTDTSNTINTTNTTNTAAADSLSGYGSLSSLFGNSVSDGSWNGGSSNVGILDSSVVSGARAKRTQILGNGQDTVTILVYMCGTDLESRSGMASRDLQEMLNAQLSDKVNIIVYTGGCSRWQNNVISSKTNQVYKISNQGMSCLVSDAGAKSMVDPATLTEFIQYGVQAAPANRYDLILWDHGGGSESGYGYDEKYSRSGAMSLSGINKALNDANVTFDFIGFDACLMATVETALVAEQHADYLIGSEETEPGIGWYYTDWLTSLSANTSMPTLEIGKQIADSFSTACATTCYGQDTTLSVIDLAELAYTVPSKMTAFARSTTDMIENSQYQTVSNARSSTREFAASSRIDQVDLVHLAKNMGTEEGQELAEALLGAVKYNTTSNSMTNAYGLSVYFPYSRASKVDSMVNTYNNIGMDAEYSKCIQSFAAMGTAGQISSGGTNYGYGSLFEQLLGSGFSSSSGSGSSGSGSSGSLGTELIMDLLNSYMSGGRSIVNGLNEENTEFLQTLDIESAAEYIAENSFDPANLVWQENAEGQRVIAMSDEQWSKLQKLQLNFFYDDGEGIMDLGMDDLYEEDEDGNLLEPQDRTWISINGQPVAYYSISTSGTQDDYTIIGRVPAELNGNLVNLIVVFNSENEDGFVAGAVYDYEEEDIDVIAKSLSDDDIEEGGYEIRFLCDGYDLEGNYDGSWYIGDTIQAESFGDLHISNTDVGDGTIYAAYVVTDIYGEQFWTPFLEM